MTDKAEIEALVKRLTELADKRHKSNVRILTIGEADTAAKAATALTALQAQLAAAEARAEKAEAALRHYKKTLCEGFCGEDMWADEGHSHPEIQRDCGGCLADSVLLCAALPDAKGKK